MLHTTRTLLSEIVDYAGLFPPAKLDMGVAVGNYAAYLAGPHAWMLGRFIVPVSRLEEFEREAAGLFPAPMNPVSGVGEPVEPPEPWRISALLGDDVDGDIERVFAFNQRHAPPETDVGGEDDEDTERAPGVADSGANNGDDGAEEEIHGLGGGAVIDTVEFKASSGREIDRLMTIVPEQLDAFIEIPISQDPRGMVAAMAGTGARAKVRTGGVTADAFPSAEEVARFISACASAEVAFKATAGLHHPVRGEFNLTYEPGCPRGVMCGFLNVFLAAAMLKTGEGTEKDAVEMLMERDPTSLRFVEQGVAWREKRLGTAKIAMVRENFAMSFGSCSFEEPVVELKGMGILD
jgi:hypothetical protein